MKKILFIESGMHGGGSAESLYQFLQVIDRERFSPIVVFLNQNRYFEKIKSLGVDCRCLYDWMYNKPFSEKHPFFLKIAAYFQYILGKTFTGLSISLDALIHRRVIRDLVDLMHSESVDLVHTNNQVNRELYAVIAAERAGLPIVSHLRSPNIEGFNPAKANFNNKRVSQYFTYTDELRDLWSGVGLEREKIVVLHNAIGDIDAAPMDLRQTYNLPQDKKIVGIIGRIIPHRGIDFLLKATAKLAETYAGFHLLVVGEGDKEYVDYIKGLVDELKLNELVTFAGYSDRSFDVIAALDLLTLPFTLQEPFGRVLMEAWQLKTPTVLTRVGYIEQKVQDGKHGLLVGNGVVDELAEAIHRILVDDELRKLIVDEGYAHCRKNFSIQKYRSTLENTYGEILEV